jgi:hypothetical protein
MTPKDNSLDNTITDIPFKSMLSKLLRQGALATDKESDSLEKADSPKDTDSDKKVDFLKDADSDKEAKNDEKIDISHKLASYMKSDSDKDAASLKNAVSLENVDSQKDADSYEKSDSRKDADSYEKSDSLEDTIDLAGIELEKKADSFGGTKVQESKEKNTEKDNADKKAHDAHSEHAATEAAASLFSPNKSDQVGKKKHIKTEKVDENIASDKEADTDYGQDSRNLLASDKDAASASLASAKKAASASLASDKESASALSVSDMEAASLEDTVSDEKAASLEDAFKEEAASHKEANKEEAASPKEAEKGEVIFTLDEIEPVLSEILQSKEFSAQIKIILSHLLLKVKKDVLQIIYREIAEEVDLGAATVWRAVSAMASMEKLEMIKTSTAVYVSLKKMFASHKEACSSSINNNIYNTTTTDRKKMSEFSAAVKSKFIIYGLYANELDESYLNKSVVQELIKLNDINILKVFYYVAKNKVSNKVGYMVKCVKDKWYEAVDISTENKLNSLEESIKKIIDKKIDDLGREEIIQFFKVFKKAVDISAGTNYLRETLSEYISGLNLKSDKVKRILL